jgi:hypothetical protein
VEVLLDAQAAVFLQTVDKDGLDSIVVRIVVVDVLGERELDSISASGFA